MSYGNDNSVSGKTVALWTVSIGAMILTVGSAWLYAAPKYRVWSAEQTGMAEFVQAEQNRKIAVLEAESKLEAAKSLALAEVERAKGVAEANKIIGESLKNNDAYLRWQWIQNLEEGNNAVIYIPTEAGLPILESGKRGNP